MRPVRSVEVIFDATDHSFAKWAGGAPLQPCAQACEIEVGVLAGESNGFLGDFVQADHTGRWVGLCLQPGHRLDGVEVGGARGLEFGILCVNIIHAAKAG